MAWTAHRSLAFALAAGFLAGTLPDVTGFVWPFVIGTRGDTLGIVPGTVDATGAFRMVFPAIRGAMVVALLPVVFGWTCLARASRRDPDAPALVRHVATAGTVVAALACLFAVAAAAEPLTGFRHHTASAGRGLAQTALACLGGLVLLRSPRGRGAGMASVGLFVVSEIVNLIPGNAFRDNPSASPTEPEMLVGFAFLAVALLVRLGAWLTLALAVFRARTPAATLW